MDCRVAVIVDQKIDSVFQKLISVQTDFLGASDDENGKEMTVERGVQAPPASLRGLKPRCLEHAGEGLDLVVVKVTAGDGLRHGRFHRHTSLELDLGWREIWFGRRRCFALPHSNGSANPVV